MTAVAALGLDELIKDADFDETTNVITFTRRNDEEFEFTLPSGDGDKRTAEEITTLLFTKENTKRS